MDAAQSEGNGYLLVSGIMPCESTAPDRKDRIVSKSLLTSAAGESPIRCIFTTRKDSQDMSLSICSRASNSYPVQSTCTCTCTRTSTSPSSPPLLQPKQKKKKTSKTNPHCPLTNSGNTKALEKLCLEPLALKLHNQIKTRKMNFTWDLVAWKSARIVSHRVSSLGEDFPDTAWRQVVIRLESDQVVTVTPAKGSKSSTLEKPRLSKAVRWVPEEARGKQQQQQQPRQTPKNSTVATAKGETAAPARNSLAATSEIEKRSGKTKRVVEYIVLQIRVIRGIEDDEWKIWGFTRPSTPASIAKDEEYFGKQLDSQAAGIGI